MAATGNVMDVDLSVAESSDLAFATVEPFSHSTRFIVSWIGDNKNSTVDSGEDVVNESERSALKRYVIFQADISKNIETYWRRDCDDVIDFQTVVKSVKKQLPSV
jgi:hypothetical protein